MIEGLIFEAGPVHTGCQNGDDSFTFSIDDLDDFPRILEARGYYAVLTGYSANHPDGDTLLCPSCREQMGLPVKAVYCDCADCVAQR